MSEEVEFKFKEGKNGYLVEVKALIGGFRPAVTINTDDLAEAVAGLSTYNKNHTVSIVCDKQYHKTQQININYRHSTGKYMVSRNDRIVGEFDAEVLRDEVYNLIDKSWVSMEGVKIVNSSGQLVATIGKDGEFIMAPKSEESENTADGGVGEGCSCGENTCDS